MPVPCTACGECPAALRRPRTGQALCRGCFVGAFEKEAHAAVTSGRLFRRGDTVAVAASGGKDSTVLAHLLRTLDAQHGYGLRLELLAVDEGIAGYRDEALGAVYRGRDRWGLPLTVVSYRELHGWTMDRVVASAGRRSNCTFCGVFRRQALDRGAAMVGADKIATGHNADDVAETVLMNFLRGDVARLRRGTLAAPEEAESSQDGAVPRCKPLRHAYEKEIVLYAYFLGLDYFSTECRYAPHAYRGHARTLLKDLEAARASAVADLGHSAERLALRPEAGRVARGACTRCGAVASQPVCAACLLLEGLERGLPRLGLGKGRRDRALDVEGEAEPREKGQGLKEEATKDDWPCDAEGLKTLEEEPRQRRRGRKAMGVELEDPHPDKRQAGALEEEEAELQQRRVWQLRRWSQNIGEEPEVNGEQQPGSPEEEETHHRRRGREATGEELQLEATVRQAEAWQRRQRRNLDF